jgi:hypothetical protein
MRTHSLAVACGTIMSVMVAGQLVAQQEQPTKTPGQPDRTPATTPATPTYGSNTNLKAPSILRDMEGVWRVEVQCGSEFSRMEHGKEGVDTRMKPAEPNRINDPNQPDANKRENDYKTPGQPANENDRDNPNRIKDPLQRSQPGENNASLMGSKTYVGYAETQLVLGDNILQQRIVIPEMMRTGSGRTGAAIAPDNTNTNNVGNGNNTTRTTTSPALGANSDEMFRGLSFISFDEGTQQYHCVFMDSRSGSMHCDSGTYNDSEKRLVFNGKEVNRTGIDMADRGMHHDDNVKVVVEVLSPSQYRVTMYNANATGVAPQNPAVKSPTVPPTENTPAPRTNNNDNKNTVNNNNQPNNNAMNENEGAIIYRATFTKASVDDSPKYRRLIQEPGMNDNDLNKPNTDKNNR